jgi:hypothetical protein
MPFIGYNDLYTCIQFRCNTEMPSMIYKACKATGTTSQTAYIQRAVVAALARDLDRPETELLDLLPTARGRNRYLFEPTAVRAANVRSKNPQRIGSFNTIEEVV